MNQSSREIEREVEATRASVEETVEALKEKMSLGQIVDEASRYFGNTGGSQALANFGAQVRDNPLPLALVGIGLAWLMSGRGTPHISTSRSRGEDWQRWSEDEAYPGERSGTFRSGSYSDEARLGARDAGAWEEAGYGRSPSSGGSSSSGGTFDRLSRTAHDVRDTVTGAAETVGSAAGSVASAIGSAASGIASAAGSVAGGAQSAASAAGRMGSGVASAAGSAADSARSAGATAWQGGAAAYDHAARFGTGAYDAASRAGAGVYETASWTGLRIRRTVADVLESEPLVLGALGLAVGAAVGAMLPRTEIEDRYLGETRDKLREEAASFAQEQFERGKTVAQEAYRTAKSEAEAAGLTNLDSGDLIDKVSNVARATIDRAREAAAEEGLTPATEGEDASENRI
jgi:hypothetical protein